jgi:hypothetical protein
MRALWKESLIAAAFRDRSKAEGKDLTVALRIDGRDRLIPTGPSVSLPHAKVADAGAARARILRAVHQTGVEVVGLSVYQPDGIAVAVTVKAAQPASFLSKKMPFFLAALGDRWRGYDGTYVALLDEAGDVAWESSSVGRLLEGSVASRQDLAGCSPLGDWGLAHRHCSVR